MRFTKRADSRWRIWLSVALLTSVPIAVTGQAVVSRPGGAQRIGPTSPRILPVPEPQWTDAQRKLALQYATEGHVGNDLRTLLNVPDLVASLMPFHVYVTTLSSLTPRHREILILRTAWLTGNQYIWSSHTPLAARIGLSAEEIRRIAQGPDARGWNPLEAALLSTTDQLYRNCFINDAAWKALSAAYDMNHLMDAVMTVTEFTTLAIMYNSMGVQPDEGNTARLPRDIPYRVVVPEREPPLTVARVQPIAGTGLAITRTFARYPALAEPRSRNANYVNQLSKLAPRYREMLILRTGWNCQAEYEWAQHVGSVGRAREHGLEPVRIAEGPNAAGWDPFDVMILRAADDMYRDAMVSDPVWKALAARFDTTMMMNVIVTASNYRMVSMALNALGVQLDAADERFPAIPRPSR
jgi:alkylhydroperoxidase family enzyme